MKIRITILFVMLGLLIGAVVWEQVYIDQTIHTVQSMGNELYTVLKDEDLQTSKQLATQLHDYWQEREKIISLMVDFRDIEQIGRQSSYIISNLNNEDFELARSECEQFLHNVQNFSAMTAFNIDNII